MSHIRGPTYPDWQRAIAAAQAPQLPSALPAVPVEERFNQTHGFHGEFATSGNAKPVKGTTAEGFEGMTANAAVEGGNKNPSEQQEAAQRASLLAQAAALETKAANSTQQANQVEVQLNAVLNQLQQLTAPFPPSSGQSGTPAGSSSGQASTSPQATGTATLAAAGTHNAPGTSGTATYADQVATLQGQASAFRTQINSLRDQASDYTQQAQTFRAQAAAIK